MKKVWLLFLLFFTGICFSETNLEIATRYYNKDDYENALQYYKSAVTEEHEVNGTTLYRLAYTCEKTGAKNLYIPSIIVLQHIVLKKITTLEISIIRMRLQKKNLWV